MKGSGIDIVSVLSAPSCNCEVVLGMSQPLLLEWGYVEFPQGKYRLLWWHPQLPTNFCQLVLSRVLAVYHLKDFHRMWSWWQRITSPHDNLDYERYWPSDISYFARQSIVSLKLFFTINVSPSTNLCFLVCFLWSNCCCSCFPQTLCSKFGFKRSNCEHSCLLINSSAAIIPVVVCGMMQYLNSVWEI